MLSTSQDWKTGYVIKTGPTEKFLYNERSTLKSGLQLKIKNHIMAYRWTFKKVPLKLEKILQATHNQTWYNKLWCNDAPSEKVL